MKKRWLGLGMLWVMGSLVSCLKQEETPKSDPLDPRLLETPPAAQENLGGHEKADSMDEDGSNLEPLPPASPGSPYNTSTPPPKN